MLDLANVQAPIETANGLPNACCIDTKMYQHEQKALVCNQDGNIHVF